jgi:hypothetical protein
MDDKQRMAVAQARAQIRGRLRNSLWPDLSTEKGLKSALSGGWGMALFIAFGYAVMFALGLIYGRIPFDGELEGGSLSVVLAIDLAAVAAALALAWFVWRRASRVAAVLVLVWVVVEVATKIVLMGGASLVAGVIFVWAAILGVRGVFAKRRLATATAAVRTFT